MTYQPGGKGPEKADKASVGPPLVDASWGRSSGFMRALRLSDMLDSAAASTTCTGTLMPPAGRVPYFPSASTPHVVLLLPNALHRLELLQRLGDEAQVTLLDIERPLSMTAPADVAVLHADVLSLACSPLFHDPELGFPELVFVVDGTWSAQSLALKSRGFRYVFSLDGLLDWLPRALPRLGSLAQARRVVLRACNDDPVEPGPPPPSRQLRGIRLHAAETSFRAVFLRSLLAEHGSRRKAAEEAGVPYRSFCEMLRKLGI